MPPPLMYFTCISVDDFTPYYEERDKCPPPPEAGSPVLVLFHVKKTHINMHTDKVGHRMFGWEYVLVFAFEFTPIVTIVKQNFTKT